MSLFLDFRETCLLTGSHLTILPKLGVYFSFLILIIAENVSFLAKIGFEIKKSNFFFNKNNLNYFDLLSHINDARVLVEYSAVRYWAIRGQSWKFLRSTFEIIVRLYQIDHNFLRLCPVVEFITLSRSHHVTNCITRILISSDVSIDM